MALVVVGGHSRSVGKTSIIAGLIATTLAYRNFFTPAQQLRELEGVEARA